MTDVCPLSTRSLHRSVALSRFQCGRLAGNRIRARLDFVGTASMLSRATPCSAIKASSGLPGDRFCTYFMGVPGVSVVMASSWRARNEPDDALVQASSGRLSYHLAQHPWRRSTTSFVDSRKRDPRRAGLAP